MNGASESSRSSVLPIVLLTRRIYGANRICFHAKRLETFFFQQEPLRLAPGKGSCLKEPPPLSRNRGGNQRYSALHPSSFISASDSIIEVQTSSDLTSGTMVTYFHPIYYTSPSTSSKSSPS